MSERAKFNLDFSIYLLCNLKQLSSIIYSSTHQIYNDVMCPQLC